MKKIAVLIFCLSFFSKLSAQMNSRESDYKHEIGVNLYTLTEYKLDYSLVYADQFNSHFANGIHYKYHKNKIACRASFDYFRNEYKEKKGVPTIFEVEGTDKLAVLRIGLERKIGESKLQAFYGADLVSAFFHSKGTSYIGNGIVPEDKNSFDRKELFIGLAPTIGINYRISDHFSASVEANVNIIALTIQDDNSVQHIGEEAGFVLNPVRMLSVNYHF